MKPAILLPAQSPTVFLAAQFYAALGLSVLPCSGKKPAIGWSAFQTRRATKETVNRWNEVGLLQNVGIICGQVSGGLVVIDLDGDKAVEAFMIRFPDLQDTYTVRSGSGHGMHFYYYARELTPTTRVTGTPFGNIELRSDGAYVVAPPSIHPDSGKPYTVHYPCEILSVATLRPVVDWIKALIKQKHGGNMPPASQRPVQFASWWAQSALRSEADAVRRSLPGGRNHALNRAAFKLGQLVGAGELDRVTVEHELRAAAHALAETDGEVSVLKTIKSGLDAGVRNPRERKKA